jgi:hypothetical protein
MHFGMPRDTDCSLMTSQNVTSNQAVEFLLRGVGDEDSGDMRTVPYRELVQTRQGRACLALAPQDDFEEQP